MHEKKAEKTSDAEPKRRRKEGVVNQREKIDETAGVRRSKAFHSFAEENVAERAEKDAEEDQRNGFELQAAGVLVVIGQWSAGLPCASGQSSYRCAKD